MSKQSFLITLVVVCLLKIDSWSQGQGKTGSYVTSDYYSNLKPGDPEHATLGSFGKTPINYYTGLPEVSFNLLTLTSRDLSVPISINYDASGVKVNDIASSVGLKWNLDAGGYVARQLNGGLPDEGTSGYWANETQINNYSSQSPSTKQTWASQCEQGTNDFEPDEFYLFVNGRLIKFVFKNKVAMTVPKLNVGITYTLDASNKINSFQLIDENGTKYIFGGSTTSIEQRKVETMNMSVREYYAKFTTNGHDFNLQWHQFDPEVTITEKSGQFYNDKWYLVSITSPSGDQVNFNYAKDADQVHITMPIVTRIDFSKASIGDFNYSSKDIMGIAAYAAFSQDCLESNAANCYDNDLSDYAVGIKTSSLWPGFYDSTWPDADNSLSLPYPGYIGNITQDQTDVYIDPVATFPNMGGTYVSQSLITESVIRLTSITTSAGNSVGFITSSRADMPAAYKYDQMNLFNMNGQLIKSIKLNFATVDADLSQDYLWLSEGMMAARIYISRQMPQTEGPWPDPTDNGYDYYAHHFYKPGYFTDADISTWPTGTVKPWFPNTDYSPKYKKYTYEGLREYNFKRLFLENIVEVTNGVNQKTLYSFLYNNRTALKRRNSPLQDEYGFSFSYASPNSNYTNVISSTYEMPVGVTNNDATYNYLWRAMITKAYLPNGTGSGPRSALYGMLTQINYPTGGRTEFVFNDSNTGAISLKSVTDKDENSNVVQTRELSYLASCYTVQPQNTSVRRFPVAGSNPVKFAQLKTICNVAQNRTFRPSAGVFKTYSKVKVYNGTSSNYKGYEIFSYDDNGDCHLDVPSTIELPGGTATSTLNDIFPFPRPIENDHKRGLMTGHDVYDKDTHIIKSTVNTYVTSSSSADSPQTQYGFFGASTTSFLDQSKQYRYGTFQITNDRVYLSKTTEKTYDQNFVSGTPQDLTKNISIVTNYTYDASNLQPIEVDTYNELTPTSLVSTKTKYATHTDYSPSNYCTQQYNTCVSPCGSSVACLTACNTTRNSCLTGTTLPADANAIVGLQINHQVTSPVEIQNWIQESTVSKLTSAVVYKYSKEGSASPQFIKPKEIWGLKQPLDASAFTTSTIDGAANLKIDPNMRKLHRYDLYDQTTANLLQQTSLDGTVSAYQWGFNNSLVTGSTVNPGTLQLQTSYTYQQPLIGLSKSTDPNLRNTNYEYDRFNRLKLVRDHDSNILTRYRYHYIGQNEILNAGITVSSCLLAGQPITFSSFDDTDFGPTTYTWNFGDGTALTTGYYVSHTFASAGTYTVLLKKSNPEQFANDMTVTVTIGNPVTSLNICAAGPISIDLCGVVNPVNSSCSGGGGGSSPMMKNSFVTPNNVPGGGGGGGGGGTTVGPTTLTVTPDPAIANYVWRYQLNGNWYNFGSSTSSPPPTGFQSHVAGTYTVQCVGTDICGNLVYSNSIPLRIYYSTTGCSNP